MITAAGMWKRLPRTQQRSALAASVVLALWASDAALLRPLRVRLSRLAQDVRETEGRLTAAMVASAQAEAVNRAFETYQPYVQPGGDPQSELGIVYAEVQSAVRDLGMPLLSLRQGEVSPDAADAVSVTLECEAAPVQLVQLLDRVQRSARLLKVTDLTVRATEGKGLRVSLVISKLLL